MLLKAAIDLFYVFFLFSHSLVHYFFSNAALNVRRENE